MHTSARLLMTSGGGFCEALLRRRLRAWPSCHTRKMERENGWIGYYCCCCIIVRHCVTVSEIYCMYVLGSTYSYVVVVRAEYIPNVRA